MANVYRLPLARSPRAPARGQLGRCPGCLTRFGFYCPHDPRHQIMTPDGFCFDCSLQSIRGEATVPMQRDARMRVRFCVPTRRVRSGFLWWRRCDEPGAHLHQHCTGCGWMGILLPAEEET